MRRTILILAMFAGLMPFVGNPGKAQERIDLELVLAVDVSRSMDIQEQLLQRRGYSAAFRSREVVDAITGGGFGKIAVLYMEWAGVGITNVIVPWTMIDSMESSTAFADALDKQSPRRLSRTSISNALQTASGLFGQQPWRGLRRVVDVSGDGPNNQGQPIEFWRDELVKSGIVINGLPLMIRTSTFGFGIENLDEYYFDCVTGGTGSFVLPVYKWEEFPQAVRRKLVLEIAGARFLRGADVLTAMPVAFDDPDRPKVDCLIGEKLWQQRMREMEWR